MPKKIEPGVLKVFDVAQSNVNEDGFGEKMAICDLRGEDFYYDLVSPLNEVKRSLRAS